MFNNWNFDFFDTAFYFKKKNGKKNEIFYDNITITDSFSDLSDLPIKLNETTILYSTLPNNNSKTIITKTYSTLISTSLYSGNSSQVFLSSQPTVYLNTSTLLYRTNLQTSFLYTTLPSTLLYSTNLQTSSIYSTISSTLLYSTNLQTSSLYSTLPFESLQTTNYQSEENNNIPENDCLEGQCLSIKSSLINISLKLDYSYSNIYDLDLHLEVLEENNNIIEKVYFANLDGLNGSAFLNRDNFNGCGNGFDDEEEILSINLDMIPSNIKSLAILINSFNGNSINNATSAYIEIYDALTEISINYYPLYNIKSGILFFYGIIEKNNFK